MKRVFVGIKVGDDLAGKIVSWQKEQKVGNVRWTSEDNLHLTLVPPWYEEDVDVVKNKLDKLDLKITPFEISFSKIFFGSKKKHPRLIWVKGHVSRELPSLKRKIEGYLGIIPEKREFKFHITLGRFKERDFHSLKNKIETESVFWKIRVDSFHLFESKLNSTGAEYKVLEKVSLQ